MSQERNLPVPGEFYRHFKNKMYQIMAVATHSETGEPYVVYQALYGEFKVWVRPLSMFMEEVDHVKYPEVTQKYRFEKAERASGDSAGKAAPEIQEETQEAAPEETAAEAVNPYLLEFFDAKDERDYDGMMEAIAKFAKKATDKEVDDMFTVLDIHPVGGKTEDKVAEIKRHILRLKKFDGERLR